MTQTEFKEYIRETVNDDLKANLIIGAFEAYSSANNDAKPIVGGSSEPVVLWGEPLRKKNCEHDWYYVGTVNAEFCNKCHESREC